MADMKTWTHCAKCGKAFKQPFDVRAEVGIVQCMGCHTDEWNRSQRGEG